MNKVNVALGLAKLSVPKKIEKGRFIVTSMTGNPSFTTPVPSLASVTTAINALETAYLAALGGGVDDTANMHAKEYTVDLLLRQLSFYVETTASANTITAEAVILSSGMQVKAKTPRSASEFHVEAVEAGSVKLSCKYSARSTFIFEMSTDPDNEESWEIIGLSTRAKMIKNGLTSATRYHFRVSVVNKDGKGQPSHVLSTVVL
ncbi:MAG TPA: fibronectin type III domain-containing protein [Flavobacteriales bacterium]|nr:fibronectin type III domain-containing protein [Flavobacteriales bacterium]